MTGDHGGAKHMGNIPVMPADKGKSKLANPTRALASVEGLFDLKGYPSAHSDVVAQLVLAHQTHMTNLITRTGWEARLLAAKPSADGSARVSEAARDLVDYLLFVDEAPLAGRREGRFGIHRTSSRRKGRATRRDDRCATSICVVACSGFRAAT